MMNAANTHTFHVFCDGTWTTGYESWRAATEAGLDLMADFDTSAAMVLELDENGKQVRGAAAGGYTREMEDERLAYLQRLGAKG
jgi:hypothetical protein